MMADMNKTSPMGRKPLGRKKIDITLPPEIAETLMVVATERFQDRSSLVEELAKEFLKKIGRMPAPKGPPPAKGKK
jgi:hypothetical protein